MQSPVVHLAPLCADALPLLKSMASHNAVLGGFKATAYFYPVVRITGAPWDFYCDGSSSNSEHFIAILNQLTMYNVAEDVSSEDRKRVVCMTGNVNGSPNAMIIRVYVGTEHPLASILDLPTSYQQSAVTAYGAICFWPRLNAKGQFRQFASNFGGRSFPRIRTRARIQLRGMVRGMVRVTPRTESSRPSVYSTRDKKNELVILEIRLIIDNSIFDLNAGTLGEVVYAVCTNSTMFLGSTAGMQ
ncbi:hypothetical protein K3495_g5604 [Podosphaera aphanis]|nr:hypothetical protein K3495_g5604 [Podosphaera aphanis]